MPLDAVDQRETPARGEAEQEQMQEFQSFLKDSELPAEARRKLEEAFRGKKK